MDERPGFGDAEAKRIIKRAAEIDAQQGRQLDAPALREIATEAGISPLAVDRALQEHEATSLAPPPWRKRYPIIVTLAAIVAALALYALLRIFPN